MIKYKISKKYLIPDKQSKITLIFLAACLFVWLLYLLLWRAPLATGQSEQFVVQDGTSNYTVGKMLHEQGFVRSAWVFDIIHFLRGDKAIESGGFIISKSMSVWQISTVLTNHVSLKWVTIQPGLRKEEIADIFAKTLGWSTLTEQEWIGSDTVQNPDYIEGVYFPDTYLVPINETPPAVAARLIAHFETVFAPYAKEALQKNIKWTTVVNLASIIQREAAGSADMPLIAGIFWNRLLVAKIPLQVDATVQYARGNKGKGWWAPISVADLKIDSPYNTYLHQGLPPHPIDSPSLTAIAAVLSPATTTCLYYIHDNNRNIHCADTYAEHQANIDKYLK